MKKLIIEKNKLQQNIDIIKGMTNATIIAVLKGNGYGLGIVEYANFLLENGISFFAAAELEEALRLRSSGIDNPILLLSSTSFEEEARELIQNRIIPTIGSLGSAVAVNEAAKSLNTMTNVHLKLDTGYGRFGFLPEEIDENLCNQLQSFTNIQISGTYTHLSFSFSSKPEATQVQFEKFMKCVEKLNQHEVPTGMLHIANSCAFLQYKSMHLDAIRIGSAFLGRIPIENKYGLSRIAHMKSRIIEIKELPDKHPIGYANTFITRNATRIGIIPVGYKDGFGVEKSRDTFRFMDVLRYIYNDFKLFNKQFYVKVNGKKVRILGRINMYNIVVDLGGTDAKVGDEVLLDINPVFVNPLIEREFVGENADSKLLSIC